MLKKLITFTYILLFINFNSFAEENKKTLKVGLLAPFSGEYKDMGQSIMLSLQLALDEIDDDDKGKFEFMFEGDALLKLNKKTGEAWVAPPSDDPKWNKIPD